MEFYEKLLKKLERDAQAKKVWNASWSRAGWTDIMLRHASDIQADKGRERASRSRRFVFHDQSQAEYLGIDLTAWNPKKGMFAPLSFAMEHENLLNIEKIVYCAWKLLCVDSPERVLVCYCNPKARSDDIAKCDDDITKAIYAGLKSHQRKPVQVIIGHYWTRHDVQGDWKKIFCAKTCVF